MGDESLAFEGWIRSPSEPRIQGEERELSRLIEDRLSLRSRHRAGVGRASLRGRAPARRGATFSASGRSTDPWSRDPSEPPPPGDALACPPQPPHTRVADLYEYDVVECFLVGEGGRYLEVELGAGGHFLVLSFDAPRVLADAHEDLDPVLRFETGHEPLAFDA